MPETERDNLPEPRTMIALAERTAVVETKIGALTDAVSVIRQNIHGINNELMKITSTEARCLAAIERMHELFLSRGVQVDKIDAAVDLILAAKNQAEGAWAATVRISAAIVASIGILGTLATGLLWLAGKLAVK